MSTTTTLDDRARAILRTDNPSDPSGQWSAWALAAALDVDCATIEPVLVRLCPSGGRYVGGTSGHLYSLPYATTEEGR